MATGTKIGDLYYQITGDSTKLNATLDQSEKKAKSLGQVFKNVGSAIAKGIAFIVTAIGGIGIATINAASDAEETRNKFSVVFRGISEEAQKAADELRNNYGLSSKASQQLLSDTGDLLSGFGFARKQALELSIQTQKLAVDLASFTNYTGGAEGASQAITKALLGETEQMKSLGVSIQQGTKQFKAQVKAVMENTGATERQAKAQVILNEIMKQSANSIGDFARSQDSFANQTRIAQARLDDLAVIIGEKFLPIGTDLVKKFGEFVAAMAENEEFMILLGAAADVLAGSLEFLGNVLGVAFSILKPFAENLASLVENQKTAATISKIMADETERQNKEFDINRKRVERLVERYGDLEQEQKSGIDNTKEMSNILKTINDIYPESINLTDGQATSYKQLKNQVKSYTAELINALEVEEAQQNLIEKRSNLKAITEPYENQLSLIDELNNKLTEYEGSLISASDFEISQGKPWKELFEEYKNLQAPEVVKALGDKNLDKLFRYDGSGDIAKLVDDLLGFDKVSEAFKVANEEFDTAREKLDSLGAIEDPGLDNDAIITNLDTFSDAEDEKRTILNKSMEYHRQMMWAVRDEYIKSQHEQLEKKREAEEKKREEVKKTMEQSIEAGKIVVSAFDGFASAMFESRKAGLDKESAEYKKVALEEFNYNKLKTAINTGISGAAAAVKALELLGPIAGPIAAGVIGAFTAGQVGYILSQKPPQFADGGIVPGNQFRGDNIIAKVNSGEMILNQQQQAQLFDMINSSNYGSQKPLTINIYTHDGRLITRQVVDAINSNGEYRIDMRRIAKEL